MDACSSKKKVKLKRIILLYLVKRRHDRLKASKAMWVRDLFKERKEKGEFVMLVKDMELYDHEYFFKCFRMNVATLEQLLKWVGPYISESSERRGAIGAKERLCGTLRKLATGDANVTIAASYRISPTCVGRIIDETTSAIWEALESRGFLNVPDTAAKWKGIAKEFEDRWNFPQCLGAIDGKHVIIQAPPRSGSDFFNYKKTFSIVLLAVCDASYKFTLVDIGDAGRQSDGGVYSNSKLGFSIENKLLDFPPDEKLPNCQVVAPYVFIGDDAFPLRNNMLKPYPAFQNDLARRIYNYWLSRARRIIENAFGIASSRFRIFHRPIIAKVETVVSITKAVVALHNFLMSTESTGRSTYCPPGFTDNETGLSLQSGTWRQENLPNEGLISISHTGSNNYAKSAKDVRDIYKDYFSSAAGAVPWQYEMVTRITHAFDS